MTVRQLNQSVTEKVKNQLNNAGYSDDMINIMTIPEKTYKMGLERGADTFCFIGRISQPSDADAYEEYISNITENSTVLLAFRAYVDETGVGASYYEIVYDRAIVFHKK